MAGTEWYPALGHGEQIHPDKVAPSESPPACSCSLSEKVRKIGIPDKWPLSLLLGARIFEPAIWNHGDLRTALNRTLERREAEKNRGPLNNPLFTGRWFPSSLVIEVAEKPQCAQAGAETSPAHGREPVFPVSLATSFYPQSTFRTWR